MKHRALWVVVAGVAFAGVSATAAAGAIDDVMKMQKNGMWEMKPPGYTGKPYHFCVTDTTKIGGLEETRKAVASLGCKTERDSLKGDKYEIALACSHANPEIGNFRMLMKGTARSDYQSGTTLVTGGGRMVQSMFPSGKEGGGENRWLRPCKAGETPGLQQP